MPQSILPVLEMKNPNESVPVYEGAYQLIIGDKTVEVNGSLTFEWFPQLETRFTGEVIDRSWQMIDVIEH